MSVQVQPVQTARYALSALAPLFEYPTERYREDLSAVRFLMSEADAQAFEALERFAGVTDGLDLATIEATYTTTFDLGASCLPYLGAHLFEPESRDRARLMVGLRMTYRKGGHESETELPDHLAEVLRFAANYEAEEWLDLLRLVLTPALTKMAATLGSTANPYRHLIESASHLCRAATVEESES